MFVILVYDVNAKRDPKVKKICDKYLHHIQRSLYEGFITKMKLNRLKAEIKKVIDASSDQCTIYKFESLRFSSKEEIGTVFQNYNIL